MADLAPVPLVLLDAAGAADDADRGGGHTEHGQPDGGLRILPRGGGLARLDHAHHGLGGVARLDRPIEHLARDEALGQERLEALRADFLKLRFGMFLHFNLATYKGTEWVEGYHSPADFDPGGKIDTDAWAEAQTFSVSGASSVSVDYPTQYAYVANGSSSVAIFAPREFEDRARH